MRRMTSLFAWAGTVATIATSTPLAATSTKNAEASVVIPLSAEDERLTRFLNAEFQRVLALEPETATSLGLKIGEDRFSDISDGGQRRLLNLYRASVQRMEGRFDRRKLSPAGQTNFDIWQNRLKRVDTRYRFRRYQPPFYSFLDSVHAALPDFLINTHVVDAFGDMRAYNARLRAAPTVLDEAILQSKLSDAAGVHAPRFQIERVIAGSKLVISGAPFDAQGPDSPLWADAQAKVAKLAMSGKIDTAQRTVLLTESRSALLALKPAYQRVINWAQAELPTAPSGRVGAVTLPGGAAWYAAAIRLNTTLDLSAQQIHAIGLREVFRIQQEQDQLAQKAGFSNHETFYADRKRRFPPQPWTAELRNTYLKRANDIVAHNRSLLPSRFNNFPKYTIEVIREPSFSEVAGGAAHANGASPDGKRPGRVWVHLLGNTSDPAYLTDLMCHEAVPGHVMQGDIQARQTGTPLFRRAENYVAFNEGTALYSELLCKEMGAYPDVASDFMRLDQELWRAARLVVDTGIHAQGWTEQQAFQYLVDTAHLSENQARSETRRYITLPGQATGYKIGMLKIMELRKRSAKMLGPKFDIKEFNDLLISGGSQPLPILERRVMDWIALKR